MLTEKATYEEMERMLKKCLFLKTPKEMRGRLERAKMHGDECIIYRNKIKGTDQPILVIQYTNVKAFTPMLILRGSEGEGFAYLSGEGGITLIASHAIRRYFNRHEHVSEDECKSCNDIEPQYLKRVQKEILTNMAFVMNVPDSLGKQYVAYFNGGVFLNKYDGKIARIYTFIMNRQTFSEQRLCSLKSEKKSNDRKYMLQDKQAVTEMAKYHLSLFL